MKTINSFVIIGLVVFCLLDKNSQYNILRKVETLLSLDKGIVSNYFLSNDETDPTEVKNQEPKTVKYRSQEVLDYYDEVVMNSEFNGKLDNEFKWTTDMLIYVDGNPSEELISELKRVVIELNQIINPIELVFVNSRKESNMVVYFGSPEGFMGICSDVDRSFLDKNWGAAVVGNNRGKMYVNTYRPNKDAQKHLIREELTQSLGLVNDSYKFPESIFYQGWTTTTEFTPIDRELIDMLYNN